jgi:hypothetical protein
LNEITKLYKNCKKMNEQSQKEMIEDYSINEINGSVQECIIDNFYTDDEIACLQDGDCLVQFL